MSTRYKIRQNLIFSELILFGFSNLFPRHF
jgi:hypothetical protein